MRWSPSLRLQSALLLVAAAVSVTTVFSLIRAGGDNVDQLASSLTQSQDFDTHHHELLDAMVNQESGVRGYALTAVNTFLEPYRTGREQLATAKRALMQSPPQGVGRLVSDESNAAKDWQQWAETRIGLVAVNGPGGAPSDSQGRSLFEAFRARWSALDLHAAGLRAGTKAALSAQLSRQSTTRVVGWFAVIAVLAALSVMLFTRILRPLVRQSRAGLTLDGVRVVDIPGGGRRDEVGDLAGALDALQTTLRERVSLTKAIEEIGGRAELDDVVDVGTRIFASQLGADEAVITLFDGASRFVAGTYAGLFPRGLPVTQSTQADIALTKLEPVASTVAEMPEGELKDLVAGRGYGPVLAVPMLTGGEPVGVVSALRTAGRDPFGIDEIRRAETLAPVIGAAAKVARLVGDVREANLVKSRFLANMSHELRTPLNAILGFSQVLSAGDFGPLNERQVRYVGHIETSGSRLLDLINDILDLSKVEAGLLDMRLENVELAQLMVASRSEIDRMAAAKGVALVYELAPAIWVSADQRRLQQVVLNLMSNGVKFTPAGGRVTLSTSTVAGRARITVSDTGIGIAPEEHDRIFDEFVQADDDSAREQKGTGLGLSLSRKLTELMGGTLTVSSEVGIGSQFTVELGLTEHHGEDGHGPLILVVEDESASTELLEVILEEADYRVSAVGDVPQAWAAILRERPQAILLDVSLPGTDGRTFLEALKRDPSTMEIPVVAVTVLDDAPPALRHKLAGFMTKPVDRGPLLSVLQRLIGGEAAGPEAVADG